MLKSIKFEIVFLNLKDRGVPANDLKAYRRSRSIAPFIPDLGSRWR